MRSSLPLLLLLLALALPAPSSAAELLLPSWLVGREDDARWLMEEGERPRALISLGENGVEVILHLPGLDPAEILRKIEEYAVYEQTELVESSFCASGAFFTGTRLKAVGIDVYTPTVTRYWTELGTGRLHMGWDLMPVDASRDYLRAHRDALAASLRRAGLDRDVDAYLAESLDKLGAMASVEGSHRYEHGFYAYSQEVHSASRVQEALVRSFGAKPQLRAALKSALFSVGREDLAGGMGDVVTVREFAHRMFRSCTIRRPWRVRKGSTCSIVSDTGAIRWASPPVATTLMEPNASAKRRTMPSIIAAKP